LNSVFFQSSGSETVEGAIKLSRRVTGRQSIIAFSGGFHGRTMGALAATSSNPQFRAGHEPLVPEIHIAPLPDVYRDFDGDDVGAAREALRQLDRMFATAVSPKTVAAVIIEPVQGEGGYIPVPLSFLRGLRERCDVYGALLVTDEVQAGLGRTGQMWGFQHAQITPDVVCLAKGIANGLPLGAFVSSRDLMERWGAGAHASTFGGNALACAAGIAVLRTIRDQDLVENAASQGRALQSALLELAEVDQGIGDVRGRGLMIGVEFVTDPTTRQPAGDRCVKVVERCLDLGLLLLTCGVDRHVVRWIPPLDVTAEEIAEAVQIFSAATAETRA
jgi:4-aminobutyrate aminotransferase